MKEGDSMCGFSLRGLICKKIVWFVLLSVTMLLNVSLNAEPYLSFYTKIPCSGCHVNPSGGGMRNDFGRLFGNGQFTANPEQGFAMNFGEVSDFLKFGGNYRTNVERLETTNSQISSSGFEARSGQVYLQAKTGIEGLSVYLDQKFTPKESEVRELFLLKTFSNGDYFKVGKMIPQLGLRLEDDSALIRQVTGFNFNNNDQGVEYGLLSGRALYTFALNTGSSSDANPDGKYRKILRAEYYLDNWRLGGAISRNPGVEGNTDIWSLFAGYKLQNWIFLADISRISDRSISATGIDRDRLASLFEVNWLFQQGHNLKLTEEYYDPDSHISEDHQVRHSLIYEYTPVSHLQIRLGIRDRKTPPEFRAVELEQLFLQLHLYFYDPL